jgi:predicted Zn-dependent protease
MAAALVLLGLAPARAQLPTLGDGSEIGSAAEKHLGDRIAREMYRDPDYIDDPVLAEYVHGIWQPLLDAARVRGELTAELDGRFAWQVLLGKERIVNAFALPGGWLGLQLGLINVTASRDEIASVLAHELSHVTQRHISRLTSEEKKSTPLLIGAMLLGVLAMGKNPNAGNAVLAGSQAVAMQGQLNFSRDMEREADRIGFGVLTQAGFQPQGFVTMFEKLQQASRINDNGSFPYLRTHPLTTERMADMQARLQLIPKGPPTPPTVALEHALIAARSKAVSSGGVDDLRALVQDAEVLGPGGTRQRRAAVYYAGSLAASKLRDHARAETFAKKLADAVQDDDAASRQARLLGAEVAIAAGQPTRALSLLGDLTASAPRPEVLLWAQARVAVGGGVDVTQRLQTWVASQPRDATAWLLLSSAYAAQGQQLRAIRADAEAQVAQLDFSAAMDRFKAAQELARRGGPGSDYIEASILDTRTRQVESLLREQSLER